MPRIEGRKSGAETECSVRSAKGAVRSAKCGRAEERCLWPTAGYGEACYGRSPVSPEGDTMRDPLGESRGTVRRAEEQCSVLMAEGRYPRGRCELQPADALILAVAHKEFLALSGNALNSKMPNQPAWST